MHDNILYLLEAADRIFNIYTLAINCEIYCVALLFFVLTVVAIV